METLCTEFHWNHTRNMESMADILANPLINAKFRLARKSCVKNSFFFSWKSDRSLSCRQWVTQWRTEGCGMHLKGVGSFLAPSSVKSFQVNWCMWDLPSAFQEDVQMLTLRYGLLSALSARNPSHTVADSCVVKYSKPVPYFTVGAEYGRGGGVQDWRHLVILRRVDKHTVNDVSENLSVSILRINQSKETKVVPSRHSEGCDTSGVNVISRYTSSSSSSVALQTGVGLGFLYNTPPGLSIPCSVSPFVYSHLSQVRAHVIQPSHFWSSSSSCCIQLSVQHLFWNCGVLHSFYVNKPSYSLPFNEPDNVLPLN